MQCISEWAGKGHDMSDEYLNVAKGEIDASGRLMFGDHLVVSAAYRLTITSTSTLLPTLAGVTLPADLRAIAIVREEGSSEVIRHAYGGAASASSPEWSAAGLKLPTTKALADTIQLYAAGTTYATLHVLTPRE